MSEFFHDTGADSDTPTAAELLAEAGLDPRAVREALAGAGGEAE